MTSCIICFYSERPTANVQPIAKIYRHGNGYPDTEDGVLASLFRFFQDVLTQTHDTRFGDACYLAAKFVVWQAAQYAKGSRPLDFIGIGVVSHSIDINYNYTYAVVCDNRTSVPVVLHKSYGEDHWNEETNS